MADRKNRRVVYRLMLDFASHEDLMAFAIDNFGFMPRKPDVLDQSDADKKVREYLLKR